MDNNEMITDVSAARPDYIAKISEIIRSDDSPKTMMTRLEDFHANDIAEAMEALWVQRSPFSSRR